MQAAEGNRAARRVQKTLQHISPAQPVSANSLQIVETSGKTEEAKVGLHRLLDTGAGKHQGNEPFRWNGWGYDDCEFLLNERGEVYLTGDRYELCGVPFPKLWPWASEKFGLDPNFQTPPIPSMPVPPPIRNEEFLRLIEGHHVKISFSDLDRIKHAHGHSGEDIWLLRYGAFKRFPDVVVWPGKHEHVEAIVRAAQQCNVAIVPYGGGTSVTLGLEVPSEERRMVVSLDMHEMNRVKWIDYSSMTACVEAGIVGKDLDAKLSALGLCMGHEPDSSEWSSLGGWISTRASGMKKSVYGNIEDIVINVKLVTPTGVLEKGALGPRQSTGPDVLQMVIGSEGVLGVITEAVVKLRPLPEARRYGSVVFPDFATGVAFLREVARQRCTPASIRLMDNLQFQFGQVLKPAIHSAFTEWVDAAKKWYVTKWCGYDVNTMVAATLLFEGSKADVDIQERRVAEIAAKFHGLNGGEENGKRGYFLTYMIAYIRDFGFRYGMMAESFETSCPWGSVLDVCEKTKEFIRQACKEHGIERPPFVTCRVTQSYDAGAAVYFYFGFSFRGLKDPLATYIQIEHEARETIIKHGGSLSHHHGVGKHRKSFMPQAVSPTGVEMLRGMKRAVDPSNIFASGNLF